MIELKNIDLSKVSIGEQLKKIDEEENEFKECLVNPEESKEHTIEEFLDTVQAMIGLLYKLGITAQDVMNYYPNHLKKLETRPRD